MKKNVNLEDGEILGLAGKKRKPQPRDQKQFQKPLKPSKYRDGGFSMPVYSTNQSAVNQGMGF